MSTGQNMTTFIVVLDNSLPWVYSCWWQLLNHCTKCSRKLLPASPCPAINWAEHYVVCKWKNGIFSYYIALLCVLLEGHRRNPITDYARVTMQAIMPISKSMALYGIDDTLTLFSWHHYGIHQPWRKKLAGFCYRITFLLRKVRNSLVRLITTISNGSLDRGGNAMPLICNTPVEFNMKIKHMKWSRTEERSWQALELHSSSSFISSFLFIFTMYSIVYRFSNSEEHQMQKFWNEMYSALSNMNNIGQPLAGVTHLIGRCGFFCVWSWNKTQNTTFCSSRFCETKTETTKICKKKTCAGQLVEK